MLALILKSAVKPALRMRVQHYEHSNRHSKGHSKGMVEDIAKAEGTLGKDTTKDTAKMGLLDKIHCRKATRRHRMPLGDSTAESRECLPKNVLQKT